jgi:4-amino-4-deoxy-L-arabinose transferase-like glycosyltransferase
MVNAEWLVNPVLGLLVLLVTKRTAEEIFGESVASATLWILIASPYFLMNSLGYMSHPACMLFLALATWLAFRAAGTHTMLELYGMLVVLALAFWVRPFTAACVGPVLVVYVLWNLRNSKTQFWSFAGAGCLTAFALVSSLLIYNKALSGSVWITPYALARNTSVPVELNLSLAGVLHNIKTITLYSLGDTLAASFCFAFILAGLGLYWEKQHRLKALALAGLFISLVLGHLVQTETSTSYIGERYYLEGYFAVAILAARGWTALRSRWNLSLTMQGQLALVFFLVQGIQFTVLSRIAFESRHAYSEVQSTVERLKLQNAIAFMNTRSESFKPQRFNANDADWKQSAVIYVRDPGPENRAAVACLLNRPNWVVVNYEDQGRGAFLEARNESMLGCTQIQAGDGLAPASLPFRPNRLH